jgi:hypothetical protein
MNEIDVSGLVEIEGFGFPIYTSPGDEGRARVVGERARNALDWLTVTLGPKPTPVAFIIGPAAWPRIAEVPIYGMPHANNIDEGVVDGLHWKVVVGTEPGEFWHEVFDFIRHHLDTEGQATLRKVYGDAQGFANRFPDFVVDHELAHVFAGFRAGAVLDRAASDNFFPRPWVSELFANLAMHGYLAEVEPAELPNLVAISLVAQHVPRSETPVRALDDMYRSFDYPNGAVLYSWYQFMLMAGAKRLWEATGRDGLRLFYDTLSRPEMSDGEILVALENIHEEARHLMSDWPV